jgi:hypothetical protein
MLKVTVLRVRNWLVALFSITRSAREVRQLRDEVSSLRAKVAVTHNQYEDVAARYGSDTPLEQKVMAMLQECDRLAILYGSIPVLHEKLEVMREECERISALYESVASRTVTLERQSLANGDVSSPERPYQ